MVEGSNGGWVRIIGQSKGFANARGEEIEKLLLELPALETSEEQ